MKCAIYCRISTLEKEDESEYQKGKAGNKIHKGNKRGGSLSRQESNCRRLAKYKQWKVYKVYRDEDESGATLNRPGMEQLRHDAKNGKFLVVVTWKQDRLSRSLLDTVRLVLEEWLPNGIQYKSVENPELDTSSSVGKILFQLLAMFAEFERERIRERMLEGKIAKTRKGKFTGVRLPFGYTVGQNKDIEIEPNEAEIIRTWYKWIVHEGLSLEKVAGRSQKLGLATKRGGKWWASNIRSMLLNDSIYGKFDITYQPVLKGGKVFKESIPIELILTSEQRIILEQAFKRNLTFSKRNATNHYLLRGLLKCKRCSRAMVGYNQEKKRADGSSFYYFTYYCSGGKKNPNSGGTGCKIPSVLGYQVEDFVWKEVKKIVKSPSILTEALEAKQGNNSLKNFDREIKIVQIQLSQKKCALNKDFELFEEGAITKDLITGRIRKLEKEIDELSAHVKDLEKNREEQKQTIVRNGSLKTQLKSLSGELERYTDEEKSRFLNLILEKIEIDCMKRIEKRESKFKVWLYFNSFFLKKLRNYPNKNKRLLHNGGF